MSNELDPDVKAHMQAALEYAALSPDEHLFQAIEQVNSAILCFALTRPQPRAQTEDGLAAELERLLKAMRENGLSIPGEPAWAIEQDRKQSANRQFDAWCRENAGTILAALRSRTDRNSVLEEAAKVAEEDASSDWTDGIPRGEGIAAAIRKLAGEAEEGEAK